MGEALTGGFSQFLSELTHPVFDDDDALLWELAASRVTMDPTRPLEEWETKVRARFNELKSLSDGS